MNKERRLHIICAALKDYWEFNCNNDNTGVTKEEWKESQDVARTFFHYQRQYTKITGKEFTIVPRFYTFKEWQEIYKDEEPEE